MKVFVVYAHPNPKSFNHAVLQSFNQGLKDGGNIVEVTDLYAINFNPCLGPADFAQFERGEMPIDILDQQKKVTRAEGLAFVFPIWWLSCPSILKGWFDRVFALGFAYNLTEKGMEGILKHKKALLINTTGGPENMYKVTGQEDALKTLFQGILKYDCGIKTVQHVIFYSLDNSDEPTRRNYLEQAYQLGKEFSGNS